MIRSIDHIVILVYDLELAMADYTDLGFTVLPGGEHADGATRNALIVFAEPNQADSSYLELIAFKREAPDHRWWRHTRSGEGLIDFALLPDAIAADIAAADEQGLAFEGPISSGRRRPDGQELAWHMGFPPTSDLPFLCADVTPRERRVPGGVEMQHANAAVGIADLTVAVTDLAVSVAHYRALPGVTPLPSAAEVEPGARCAVFSLGASSITLAAPPDNPNSPLRAHLDKRGEGPYALTLRVKSGAAIQPPQETQVHGVPLQFVR
jgi:hypothetical protein